MGAREAVARVLGPGEHGWGLARAGQRQTTARAHVAGQGPTAVAPWRRVATRDVQPPAAEPWDRGVSLLSRARLASRGSCRRLPIRSAACPWLRCPHALPGGAES